MRYLSLCTTLVLSLLIAPACERANPPDDASVLPTNDAGLATDGGTTTDARPSRPGAGPLDPDLTIDCEETTTVITKDPATGRVTGRTGYTTAAWSEGSLPGSSWTCFSDPINYMSCNDRPATECELLGPALQVQCLPANWNVGLDGANFVICGFWSETDPDGDGVFEQAYPYDARGAHVAIIR